MAEAKTVEQFEFKAEVQKLLGIIAHSLYTNREIFLRELISNSSDALDKLKFAMTTDREVADADLALSISIEADKDAGTLTVTDTGIGMDRDELVENIGTIARSGSEEYMKQMADQAKESGDASGIIGRFGVGFYSVFMVADEVVVRSRGANPSAGAWEWRSTGEGSYELSPAQGEVSRGTQVVLKIKEDAQEYLDPARLREVVKKHSNFISFPIHIEGEQVNTISALWREPKFNITKEQYAEFYKFLTFDHEDPRETIHVSVDAPVQFNALMFVPAGSHDPFGMNRDRWGLDLYVRRVLIAHENKELLPQYLSFVKGVVDTEDLPLNISRETLQENVVLRKISQSVVKHVLSHLAKVADERPDDYAAFWETHGKTFKLGYSDYANQAKVAPLLRFNSSHHDDAAGLTSLSEYVARIKPGQKAIYYISGPSREAIELSPHLEIFRKKGLEVLYLFEPYDEFAMDALREYDEHPLTSVEHAGLEDLEQFESSAEEKKAPELDEDEKKNLEDLLAGMKKVLGERVTEVKLSERLSDSPCCLVSPDGGMTSHMQKILHIVNKDVDPPAKAMEVNPDHPLVRNLLKIFRAEPADKYVQDATEQLYESALLLEGYLTDPHRMVKRINTLLSQASDWYVGVKKL